MAQEYDFQSIEQKWQRYWDCLGESLEIFGQGMAGSHFMVGMGETEQEMAGAMQRVRDMGGFTHLFSFFPESGSHLRVATFRVARLPATAGSLSEAAEVRPERFCILDAAILEDWPDPSYRETSVPAV